MVTVFGSPVKLARQKYFYNEVTLLKVAAILFITWFHFKWFVPESLSPIFIGGAIGNSIFFFCSGYLLSFKEERYYGQWLLRKYIRIMSAVWITLLLIILCTFFREGLIICYPLYEWLFPQQFWFVRAILVYFLISYVIYLIYSSFFEKDTKLCKKWLLSLIMLSMVVHVTSYLLFVTKDKIVMDDNSIYCWFYWYAFFLLGNYERYWGRRYSHINKASVLECIFSIALLFIYKRIAPYYWVLTYLQYIIIPVLLLYIVYSFWKMSSFLFALSIPSKVEKVIVAISNMTLEVYLVQWYLIQWIMPFVPFPLNIIATLMMIFVIAYVNHCLAQRISFLAKTINI